MEKRPYEVPEMEIMHFETADCITVSDDTINANQLPTG